MGLDLSTSDKAVGLKQCRKAVREGRARLVYLARDADPAVTDPVEDLCREAGIPVDRGRTMAQLGQACRIAVGASAVALLKNSVFSE